MWVKHLLSLGGWIISRYSHDAQLFGFRSCKRIKYRSFHPSISTPKLSSEAFRISEFPFYSLSNLFSSIRYIFFKREKYDSIIHLRYYGYLRKSIFSFRQLFLDISHRIVSLLATFAILCVRVVVGSINSEFIHARSNNSFEKILWM